MSFITGHATDGRLAVLYNENEIVLLPEQVRSRTGGLPRLLDKSGFEPTNEDLSEANRWFVSQLPTLVVAVERTTRDRFLLTAKQIIAWSDRFTLATEVVNEAIAAPAPNQAAIADPLPASEETPEEVSEEVQPKLRTNSKKPPAAGTMAATIWDEVVNLGSQATIDAVVAAVVQYEEFANEKDPIQVANLQITDLVKRGTLAWIAPKN